MRLSLYISIFFITSLFAEVPLHQRGTDPSSLNIAKGFKVELLYNVPKEKEGSWITLTGFPYTGLSI